MYSVYILYSASHDRYYIGQTGDLEKRLTHHNSGEVFSTKAYSPWQLVHHETYDTRSEAMKRERAIKGKKSRKYIEYLLNRQSPEASSGLITRL